MDTWHGCHGAQGSSGQSLAAEHILFSKTPASPHSLFLGTTPTQKDKQQFTCLSKFPTFSPLENILYSDRYIWSVWF